MFTCAIDKCVSIIYACICVYTYAYMYVYIYLYIHVYLNILWNSLKISLNIKAQTILSILNQQLYSLTTNMRY